MSQLYIIHGNRTAGIYLEGNPYLKRYVNMDTGKIAFTTGTRTGGRQINPEGKLGRSLIKTAREWIDNPNTVWHDEVVWYGLWKNKYPPFNEEGRRRKEVEQKKVHSTLWVALFTILILLVLVLANS